MPVQIREELRAIPTAVSKAELERRRDAVLAQLSREAIDVAVFTTAESVLYLTGIQIGGFWGIQAVVLSGGGHRFVPRGIEMHWRGNWAPQTWCTEWTPYQDDEDPVAVIADAVKTLGGGSVTRLGLELERRSISHTMVTGLVEATGAESVVSVTHIVEGLRVIKSAEEVAHLREAGRISRVGQETAADTLRQGGTDADAVAAGISSMYKDGSEFVALGPLVAIGAESAMAHPPWRRQPPRDGELVTIETSASVFRYQGPIERTYIRDGASGESPGELQDMLAFVAETTAHVVGALRPGLTSQEADRIARERFEEVGWGHYFINRLGYSIGLAFPPVWWENDIMQLRPGDERPLVEGMAFHLVPALHVPGAGYMVRSRALVLTVDGCELLNEMPLEVDPL